jgi:delta14-sterol reductase
MGVMTSFLCQIDGKMFLYLAGAVMLTIHLLAGAALHAQRWEGGAVAASRSDEEVTAVYNSECLLSRAMTVYLCCFAWFCTEYLYFEDVHTFTYDLFAERLGFKLVWGCLCFYPHFYCIGVWSMLDLTNPSDDLSRSTSLAIVLLFFVGWGFTRGANLQKFWHKCQTTDAQTGVSETLHEYVATHPAGILVEFASSSLGWHGLGDTVPGSGGRLLCSGWWGLSRHVNYFGEIIQAVALALPGYLTTGSLVPWLYPLYYVVLFVPRQVEDDEACEIKCGA